ncbi:tRNA threonylcarbamoyladenosine biosynthesis protein TsaE [Salsuginibacillus halophilus]|uniref:tRNA threonylcarbamoyladenosine biosynthesis protein TsaE n=1 Tax=Salsuginibacillus halophilus TaxID=517424 RepID=A0A2P8HL35_9BACI|nr:tRNA (adenosine(37)-N6)-threonylcarbamoyltransferase complex ATPase subunit type 1 TsaE [Salsuginibacillus halophilus]PSL46929.1 tRNA threonylcarbamoyladenosine biosynthesis protein TsaE [Salsuginibacillus halophilus]
MASFVTATASETETINFGEILASYVGPGMVFTLSGDLGAGKTHFTKGIGRGLGVKQTVNSPTFTIIKEYEGTLPLHHMDVYRLEEDSAEELGLDEYFFGEGLVVIEWAERVQDQLPKEYLAIDIERINEVERRITLTPKGQRYTELCEELHQDERTSN